MWVIVGSKKTEKASTEIVKEFNTLLSTLLGKKSEVRKEINTYYKHNPNYNKRLKEAKELNLVKRKIQNIPRKPKSTHKAKFIFCETLRHYDYILKEQSIRQEFKEIKTAKKSITFF